MLPSGEGVKYCSTIPTFELPTLYIQCTAKLFEWEGRGSASRLEMETVKFLSFAVKCPVQSVVELLHYIYLIAVPARLPEVCRGSEDARELVLTR